MKIDAAVIALLRGIAERDIARLGTRVDASPERNRAVKAGLVVRGRKTKAGHGYLWLLTEEGRTLL